jgi:hypothetical protein
MKDFDLKQWLFENKLGSYEKASRLKEFNTDDAFSDGNENRGDMSEITQAVADAEMEREDDLRGDMVDNVSMGVVAEEKSEYTDVKIEEWTVTILGKTYLIDANVDVDFHYEESDYIDHMVTSEGGFVVDDATATITKLGVMEGDNIREITDPAAIKQIQDLINTDPKLKRALEDEAAETIDWWEVGGREGEYEDDRYEQDMDETVGYAMITKPSDPAERGE